MVSTRMNQIDIILLIAPEPKRRHRSTRSGIHYSDPKTVIYERCIKTQARAQHKGPLLKGPLDVEMEFFCRRPKKPSRDYPSRGDLSNLCKAVEDAFNETIWHDDDQITHLTLLKEWAPSGAQPYIRVKITERRQGIGDLD